MDAERAVTCKFPGCDQAPAPADGPGRPPAYCINPEHTALKAWRERQRLAAGQTGVTVSDAGAELPVTMARASALEMLREMRTLADRMTDLADQAARDQAAAHAAAERAAAAEARADHARADASRAREEAARELSQVRADADRQRAEMRTVLEAQISSLTQARDDLRARAERAERDLDQVRAELVRRNPPDPAAPADPAASGPARRGRGEAAPAS